MFTQKLKQLIYIDREMLHVDFPGKYVLPLPYEYVLGKRDVTSFNPKTQTQ